MRNQLFISILIIAGMTACGKKSSNPTPPVVVKKSLLSISDVQQKRDNSFTKNFQFTVNVDNVSAKPITVDYTTLDGTATSKDYTPKSGTLTIPANQYNITIDIPVRGDSLAEPNKIFYVQLSNPVNATISGSGKATGTIICTDGSYVPIDDVGYNAPTSYPGLSLKWSDEFDQASLDLTSWSYETGNSGWGNNELENYTNSDKNSYLTKGYLVLEARQEAAGNNNYTSARLITKGKREFKYGRMDIRAKLPKGKGIWPAIWMLGSNISTTAWPACGEIDIMELLGHEPSKMYGTMHWGVANGASSQSGGNYILPGEDFSQKFHVFSIVWDTDKIEWYVDNQKFFTGNRSSVTGNNPFDDSFFFILNLAVGGNWPGNPDGTTVFPQRMLVDYVRVYQ
jgi:Glycosyl hydrolases family 16/Calx-beta domain